MQLFAPLELLMVLQGPSWRPCGRSGTQNAPQKYPKVCFTILLQIIRNQPQKGFREGPQNEPTILKMEPQMYFLRLVFGSLLKVIFMILAKGLKIRLGWPKRVQNEVQMAQESAKKCQDIPKTGVKSPKIGPRKLETGPQLPKIGARWSKTDPRQARDGRGKPLETKSLNKSQCLLSNFEMQLFAALELLKAFRRPSRRLCKAAQSSPMRS
jgi:hypothetical protein